MFHKKFKLILTIFLSLIFVAFLVSICLFVYGFPRNPINIAVSIIGYKVAPNKRAYLKLYSPVKRDIDAGHIPEEFDDFLCRQIENTNDDEEVSGIVNFYVIQAGGREGECIYNTSEQAKQKILAQLVKDMDDDSNLEKRLILLEEIRRGESLGKGRIGRSQFETERPSTPEEWEQWENKALPIAKEKFREWWNTDLTWEQKRKINPLEDSIVAVYECCG